MDDPISIPWLWYSQSINAKKRCQVFHHIQLNFHTLFRLPACWPLNRLLAATQQTIANNQKIFILKVLSQVDLRMASLYTLFVDLFMLWAASAKEMALVQPEYSFHDESWCTVVARGNFWCPFSQVRTRCRVSGLLLSVLKIFLYRDYQSEAIRKETHAYELLSITAYHSRSIAL